MSISISNFSDRKKMTKKKNKKLTLWLHIVQQLPICKDREKSKAKSAVQPCCVTDRWLGMQAGVLGMR